MGETDTRKIWGSQRRPELPPKSTTSLPASLEPKSLLLLLLLLVGRPAGVLLPSGAVHRSAANADNKAAELLVAAGWIDWDAAAGAS